MPSMIRRSDTGAFTWTANVSELTALQRWMTTGFNRATREPDMLAPIINRFGYHTHLNFRDEQWPNGSQDWVKLTTYTRQERNFRGYPPDHPILQQSGQLKRLAADPFRNWRIGQRSIRPRTEVAPYGDNTPLSVTASISRSTFTATISGERVKNQNAYYISRRDGSRVGVPPRPFWGLTRDMIDEGVSGKGVNTNNLQTPMPYSRRGSASIFLAKWYEQRRNTR